MSFHQQFFRGKTKVSLVDLVSVKRQANESIDEYLNRLRQIKARCLTQVPKHELVQMAARGLEYSTRKKLINRQLRDMAQLAERVSQIEQLRQEKEKNKRFEKHPRKDKVAYVGMVDQESSPEEEEENVENEVDLAELKPGPRYMCITKTFL